MNTQIAELLLELGMRHGTVGTAGSTGSINLKEAGAAVAKLNGCSEEHGEQIVNALAGYAQDPNCNKMFYSSLASNYGAAQRGEDVILATACFADLANGANNDWSFAEAEGALTTLRCNGIAVAFIGVAPMGVNINDYLDNTVVNQGGFMSFTLLLAEGENGNCDLALGLIDVSGVDVEWFVFDTEQPVYLAVKTLLERGGAPLSLYLRTALYTNTPIKGVLLNGNDGIAEQLLALIDPAAGGVQDVTPAEGSPDEEVEEVEETDEDNEETDTSEEIATSKETDATEETGTLEEVDTHEEIDTPKEVGATEEIDTPEETDPPEEIDTPESFGDYAFDTGLEEEGQNSEFDTVTLGRSAVDAILRRVVGDSDDVVFAVLGVPKFAELAPTTPVSVSAISAILTDEFYTADTVATFEFYVGSNVDDGTISSSAAIEAIASAIWGRGAKYNRKRNLRHAATLLARHADELWYGAYTSDEISERLADLGYTEALSRNVRELMREAKQGGDQRDLLWVAEAIQREVTNDA
ncbi:hypothetical protein FACS1894208_00090 [Clostridia bacterium]|nr:hypothetical protein FACS1894208_00090 [Clostridia bacterium]